MDKVILLFDFYYYQLDSGNWSIRKYFHFGWNGSFQFFFFRSIVFPSALSVCVFSKRKEEEVKEEKKEKESGAKFYPYFRPAHFFFLYSQLTKCFFLFFLSLSLSCLAHHTFLLQTNSLDWWPIAQFTVEQRWQFYQLAGSTVTFTLLLLSSWFKLQLLYFATLFIIWPYFSSTVYPLSLPSSFFLWLFHNFFLFFFFFFFLFSSSDPSLTYRSNLTFGVT